MIDTQSTNPEIADMGKIVAAINLSRRYAKGRGLPTIISEEANVTLLDTSEEATWHIDPLEDNYRLGVTFGELVKVLLKGPEFEAVVPRFEAAKDVYSRPDLLRAMLASGSATETTVDYLEREIVGSYQPIGEVKAIYACGDQATHRTVLLLSPVQYDRALMDRLLGIEYELHEAFPGLFLSFSYTPLLGQRKRDVVHPTFKLLFER